MAPAASPNPPALKVGDPAPDFQLVGDDDKTHKLGDYRGKRVILYFYPKDSTPGCTQEACDFRDQSAALGKQNTVVLGVSPDSVASHKKFKEKYELSFTLLSDPGAAVAKQYGAYGEKVSYGKKTVGMIRSTFVIGPDGKLAAVYGKVVVKGHVDKVVSGIGG